ncbi:MAG: M18 family aminopeptidase [Clostridiales bacterium]|nr:M18 family aminopeptidase [Clostridiales bacterium]
MEALLQYLKNSFTAYHAVDNAKDLLLKHGFRRLIETEDWTLCEGGKYFIERGGSSLIAFTVGSLNDLSYKIVASHTDSPALKLKENPIVNGAYATLNVETYGGGLWYSFLDRPLKIAGRVIVNDNSAIRAVTVESPCLVTIPSVAIHQNREANDKFSVNPQIDLQPLVALSGEGVSMETLFAQEDGSEVISYDLYLVNADMPYTFGVNNEFFASPRIDNLTSVYSSLEALIAQEEIGNGICVAACMDNEETGSLSAQGADGDFLENTLRRIAYALRFDDNEYYKALASSFMLSADNAHALHPNHPEKSDPTNKTRLGGGIVIKSHANKAYTTDGMSSAIVKTLFKNAGVKYQTFFNRSDVRSGSTLGSLSLRHAGMYAADIGLAQLAMHSACECFAKADYQEMINGLKAFYGATFVFGEEGVAVHLANQEPESYLEEETEE